MKISRKKLKQIIKEHLDEGMFDWVPPPMNENLTPINTLEDLKNAFDSRSRQGTVARFSAEEARTAIALLGGLREVGDKGNAYAICTAQVGREDKEKYEKCVKNVAKKPGYHK